MTNRPFDSGLAFDTELSLSAPFSGATQLIGTLTNIPVILMFKNQSTATVFVSDNPGSTKGTTMIAGEEIIFDCSANGPQACQRGFGIGTNFYCKGPSDGGITGAFKISVLYAP